MDMTVGPFTVTPLVPLSRMLLLIPVVVGLAGLEPLVPKRVKLPPGDSTNPLSLKLRLLPGHVGLFKTLNQQAKREVTPLGDLILSRGN